MSQFTADQSNLDTATRDYLSEVARVKGRGSPGIYVPGNTNAMPVLSFLLGSVVLALGLILALKAPKAPWATAMLVTAIVLLGGWMVLYPIRRAFGGGLGTFQYFDPLHVFESRGREVTVTDLHELSNLNLVEHFNDGNYQHTILTFHVPGKPRTIAVANNEKADLVANYYGNVLAIREEGETDEAVLGATAKHIAREGEPPQSEKLLDLSIREVPDETTATKTGGFALRAVVIVAVAAAIFAASWQLLSPVQDDMIFADAKSHGIQGYRDYLLDERHTRHRDEAKAKIAELYQPLIKKAAAAPDANERKGWTEMLEDLAKVEGLPVVSMTVREEGSTAADVATRQQKLQTWLADSIGSHFGPTFIVFVKAPDGVKPHLEVVYRRDPVTKQLFWQSHYRRTPTSDPITGPQHVIADTNPLILSFPSPAFQQAFFQKTFGTTVPMIHAAPTSGGNF